MSKGPVRLRAVNRHVRTPNKQTFFLRFFDAAASASGSSSAATDSIASCLCTRDLTSNPPVLCGTRSNAQSRADASVLPRAHSHAHAHTHERLRCLSENTAASIPYLRSPKITTLSCKTMSEQTLTNSLTLASAHHLCVTVPVGTHSIEMQLRSSSWSSQGSQDWTQHRMLSETTSAAGTSKMRVRKDEVVMRLTVPVVVVPVVIRTQDGKTVC